MSENIRKNPFKIPVDWRHIIYRAVESEEIDYKAAQNWHDLKRVEKAKFARHCMAMANTKGGYVVVGVGEDKAGRPKVYTGLTEDQARSFDPTDVGHFINRFSDPQIDFDLERPVVDGKRYAVFVIRRFSSLPHVCGYSCESELQQGVFYVRTADASSRPAYRASEIHEIIQRALRNQRELLGRMLRGILYEGKQSLEPEVESLFNEQIGHSRQTYLKKSKTVETVLWEIAAYPESFEPEKFSLSEIKRAMENAMMTFSDNVFIKDSELSKGFFTNVALRVFPDNHEKFCQVFQSALFHYMFEMELNENDSIKYYDVIKLVSESIHFLGQFYSGLGYYDEIFTIKIRLTNTEKVMLNDIPESEKQFKKSDYICLIPEIKIKIQRSAADLSSGHVQHSGRIIKEICERFNMPEGRHEELEKIISSFLEKRNI